MKLSGVWSSSGIYERTVISHGKFVSFLYSTLKTKIYYDGKGYRSLLPRTLTFHSSI